jgi:hypothetical protein
MFSVNDAVRIAGLLAFGGVVVWSLWVHPRLVEGRQVRNWAIVQSYVAFINSYHEEHGTFPLNLSDAIPSSAEDRARWLAARDNYGRPLHYSSDGAQFVLVSYGQDGVKDGPPTGLDEPELAPANAVCKNPNRDTMYSSNGHVQLCGK